MREFKKLIENRFILSIFLLGGSFLSMAAIIYIVDSRFTLFGSSAYSIFASYAVVMILLIVFNIAFLSFIELFR